MAGRTQRVNPKTGRYETASIDADISDSDMADSASKEKLTNTSGLGSYKPKASVEETDPEKMSPMARAAYETKKKRKVGSLTTDDAAMALGSRR